MNKQQLTRTQFGRQPAHIVLVDFSPPFGSDSCCQVQQALQDILALTANITGPPRVPFFGLFAIGTYPELELMVVTCRHSNIVNREVEKVCCVLDMDVLKKVQVVCMSQPEDLGASDLDILEDSPSNNTASGGEAGLSCGMVDVVHLDNDGVSLHQFLKSWLVDSGTDREHLHLTLPGMAGIGALTMKCDLSERILDPTNLLQPLNFALLPDNFAKSSSTSAQSRTTGSAVPVYKLTAVKLVNTDSICESVVYGMPLVVTATSCWKLDWEELESNQTNFHALCHMLQEKGLAILATRDPPPAGQYQQKSPRPSPRAHFLLLPSQSTSLLIKPVAVGELLLPCDFIRPAEAPAQEAMDTVESSVAQLEVEDMFNPLLVKSGLYNCLTPHVRQPTTGQQAKHRFQYSATPQAPQTSMSSGSRHAPQPVRGTQTNQGSSNQKGASFKRPDNNQRGRFCPPKAKKSRVLEQDDMFPDFTPDF
ncbi:PREDICTED: meiosis 1 arrest protein-like [Branchiostoma belcheri]|uniref:Meiosis 1 arrest protein-like n=1 Tax=Branchiostoma belcheri TaxID=7741 RepID=A0A6P4YK49_BRABE|nr:PREDICTED: meiosis 1 arrest protein-like [Branchiostoma belcheri]